MAFVQNNEIYHYHTDHLGTPQDITNAQGNIVWSARYRAYGNLALADIEEVENNLRIQGQYFDEETGLHYNRFRYYDPNCGRFINQDPIGLMGGLNCYQYVPNPISWIDPLGLSCKENARQQDIIPDDFDLLENIHVNNVVQEHAGKSFIEKSDEIQRSLVGLPDNLYQHEFLALRTYTGPYYKEMNGVLRGKEPELAEKWSPVNSSAIRALGNVRLSQLVSTKSLLT